MCVQNNFICACTLSDDDTSIINRKMIVTERTNIVTTIVTVTKRTKSGNTNRVIVLVSLPCFWTRLGNDFLEDKVESHICKLTGAYEACLEVSPYHEYRGIHHHHKDGRESNHYSFKRGKVNRCETVIDHFLQLILTCKELA